MAAEAPQTNGVDEHPEAEAMRQQVEYYFCDDNLHQDLHLLQCCGGRQNLPVSISRICGFRKMRKWKKKDVTQALRSSAFLNVTDDGKMVLRKVPIAIPTLLDPADDGNDADCEDIEFDPRSKPPEKKKGVKIELLSQTKKLPSGVSKNMAKPTGFEEYYTEVITPAQAEEEEMMYDPDKGFTERIQLAIQRFKQKKRMHEIYSRYFSKWMRFGGIECGPRMFGAKPSPDEMKELDASEITERMATHHVPNDRSDENEWVVDFEGVAKAFLSSFFPTTYGRSEKDVKTSCQVLRAFYNYLLQHNVCPEYTTDILSARKICDQADTQLLRLDKAWAKFPGTFNTAASTLFNGFYSGLYVGDADWAKQDPGVQQQAGWAESSFSLGMKTEEALIIFKTGIAVYGTDAQIEKVNDPGVRGIKVTHEETIGLEITNIAHATAEAHDIYATQNNTWSHKLSIPVLGKLTCKPWAIPSFDEYDRPANYTTTLSRKEEYTFFVEDEVLRECFLGMKLEAKVLWLNLGVEILDAVIEAHPSFYEYLPNELWMQHKPKEIRMVNKGHEDSDVEDGGETGRVGRGKGADDMDAWDGEGSEMYSD